MNPIQWQIHYPGGRHRVLVTQNLPGSQWLEILARADCRVEVCMSQEPLTAGDIQTAMGTRCQGVIGQLTENWDSALFDALGNAGGKIYSNYAVGYNNVDVEAATGKNIPVGNTPGVLTEATAQMAVALTFAAARRIGEAERFIRSGKFTGWRPDMFIGELLWRKTLGIVGAGRIGSAYANMMVQGHKMDLVYFSRHKNPALEADIAAYGEFLRGQGQKPVTCRQAQTIEGLLESADCVSLHTTYNESIRHLIDARRLTLMKPNAILINTSRGAVIDEQALVDHCRKNPEFKAGLDVFEEEPRLALGLDKLDNVVIAPHIASATRFSREGMAILAATNVAAILSGYPVWNRPDVRPFLSENSLKAAPSIINSGALRLPVFVSV